MQRSFTFQTLSLFCVSFFVVSVHAWGQSANAGTIGGTVEDPSGAIVANAKVEISYLVSGFHRETTSGGLGDFRFANVPFNRTTWL